MVHNNHAAPGTYRPYITYMKKWVKLQPLILPRSPRHTHKHGAYVCTFDRHGRAEVHANKDRAAAAMTNRS